MCVSARKVVESQLDVFKQEGVDIINRLRGSLANMVCVQIVVYSDEWT